MTKMPKRTEVEERGYVLVKDHTEHAGLVAWWQLSGETSLAKMVRAAAAESFDPAELPSPPGEDVALRRACMEHKRKRLHVDEMPGGGWQLTRVIVDDSDPTRVLRYERELGVKINEEDGVLEFDPSGHDLEDRIAADWHANLGRFAHSDISQWLIRMSRQLLSVRLRRHGGLYFVPADKVEEWNKLARIVKAGGEHRVIGLPARKTSDFLDEVLDAISAEATKQIEKIREDLKKKEQGKDALATRTEMLETLAVKLAKYEGIVGRGLDALQERIEETQASISVALIKLQKEDES